MSGLSFFETYQRLQHTTPGGFCKGSKDGDRQTLYRYPLVQYKVAGGSPVVLAIEDGIPALQPVILCRERLILGGQSYPRGELRLELEDCLLGNTEEPRRYRFASPWFGLNQANFSWYKAAGQEEKKRLLERVLTGNLLSLSKGLGVTVERRRKSLHFRAVCPIIGHEKSNCGSMKTRTQKRHPKRMTLFF